MSLIKAIQQNLDVYFDDLEGEEATQVLDMVVGLAEKTTLAYVMERVNHNQSKAARILGVSRNTLRKKLMIYQLSEV